MIGAGLVTGSASRSVAVAAAVGVALLGSSLLALTPGFEGRPGLQTLWVVVSLVLLKLPLLGLVWWLIARRRGGTRRGRWDAAATDAHLASLEHEVAAAASLPDAAARLEDLRARAWRAAREGDAAATPRAVEIALGIDRLRLRESGPAARERISPK